MNVNNKHTSRDTTMIAATPARVVGDATATRHDTRFAARRVVLTSTRHDAVSDGDSAVRDAVVALALSHRIGPASNPVRRATHVNPLDNAKIAHRHG